MNLVLNQTRTYLEENNPAYATPIVYKNIFSKKEYNIPKVSLKISSISKI